MVLTYNDATDATFFKDTLILSSSSAKDTGLPCKTEE
jgi:hypothetical protein